jgi:hypothetical protein
MTAKKKQSKQEVYNETLAEFRQRNFQELERQLNFLKSIVNDEKEKTETRRRASSDIINLLGGKGKDYNPKGNKGKKEKQADTKLTKAEEDKIAELIASG